MSIERQHSRNSTCISRRNPQRETWELDDWEGGSRNSRISYKRKFVDKTEDERSQRREKNRLAARDSRARKVQCLTNLQHDIAALHKANSILRERLGEVTEQTDSFRRSTEGLMTLVEDIRLELGLEAQTMIQHLLQSIQGMFPSKTANACKMEALASFGLPEQRGTALANLSESSSLPTSPRTQSCPGEVEGTMQFVPLQPGVASI